MPSSSSLDLQIAQARQGVDAKYRAVAQSRAALGTQISSALSSPLALLLAGAVGVGLGYACRKKGAADTASKNASAPTPQPIQEPASQPTANSAPSVMLSLLPAALTLANSVVALAVMRHSATAHPPRGAAPPEPPEAAIQD